MLTVLTAAIAPRTIVEEHVLGRAVHVRVVALATPQEDVVVRVVLTAHLVVPMRALVVAGTVPGHVAGVPVLALLLVEGVVLARVPTVVMTVVLVVVVVALADDIFNIAEG